MEAAQVRFKAMLQRVIILQSSSPTTSLTQQSFHGVHLFTILVLVFARRARDFGYACVTSRCFYLVVKIFHGMCVCV